MAICPSRKMFSIFLPHQSFRDSCIFLHGRRSNNNHASILQILIMCWQMFMVWTVIIVAVCCHKMVNGITRPAMAEASSCQKSCGNITVPYPFGVGDGCAFSPDFLLHCNQTSTFANLFLGNSGILILNLSLDEGTMIISVGAARDCYSTGKRVAKFAYNITLGLNSPFTFSYTRNKLVGQGCDNLALILDLYRDNLMKGSCTSLCDGNVYTIDNKGSCSGDGCCQTSIQKGLKDYVVQIGSVANYSEKVNYTCNYAYLIGDQYYSSYAGNFDLFKYPYDDTFKPYAVVDWVIDNRTCEEATAAAVNSSKSSLPACVSNSICINSISGPGYRCLCKEGFAGNPYEECQDIDECKDLQKYPCEGSCINTNGNYTCNCPVLMHGDGKVGCKGIGITTLAIGIGMGFGVIFLFAGFYMLYKYMEKKKNLKRKMVFFKKNGGLLLEQQISSNERKLENTRVFTSEELNKATDFFNTNRVLGKGGQATVYKGMLSDGTIVAVKKPAKIQEGQTQQFINEVVILSQINHKHVVKLLGCCLETEVPILVYEFLSNGSLWNLIHDPKEEFETPLQAHDRLRIAREVAMALAYMHSATSVPIYHRDIKSSNILLGEQFQAKISDFGISRIVPAQKTHLTTLVQGTFGYVDPEYFRSNQFTDKSDVYSYGIVLVELLTGQKPVSDTVVEGEMGLGAKFMSAIEEKHLVHVLDPLLLECVEERKLIAIANLAKRCLKLSGKKRPTMAEVALQLENLERTEESLTGENSFQNEDFAETSNEWDIISIEGETARTINNNELEFALLTDHRISL